MSDKALAQTARALAAALIQFARERDEESRKRISHLHYELCMIYRQDLEEQATDTQTSLNKEQTS